MQAHTLFPTPLWYDTIPFTELERQEAIFFCKKIQEYDPVGITVTNIGGWHSKAFTYNDVISTPFLNYFNYIIKNIDKILIDIGSPGTSKLINAWVNINNKNNSNKSHNHPGSILSGVFYLTKRNSKVVFKRPVDANMAFLIGIKSSHETYLSFAETYFIPNSHDLIIFPSWLEHYVELNEYNEERISIAFNIDVNYNI